LHQAKQHAPFVHSDWLLTIRSSLPSCFEQNEMASVLCDRVTQIVLDAFWFHNVQETGHDSDRVRRAQESSIADVK